MDWGTMGFTFGEKKSASSHSHPEYLRDSGGASLSLSRPWHTVV